MIPLVLTIVLGLSVTSSDATSSGCNSTFAINTLDYLPSNKSENIKIFTPRRYYERNVPFNIKLISLPENKITSFYLQAMNVNHSVVGQFMTSYTDDDVMISSCFNQSNTATENQDNFVPRNSVNIYWKYLDEQLPRIIYFVANVQLENESNYIQVSSSEIILKPQKECYTGNGADYRGSVHTTLSGIECQRWDTNTPHLHHTTKEYYPEADLTSNFCRNMDNDTSPWCYTTDPLERYEGCDIPICIEELPDYFLPFGKHVGDVKPTANCSDYILLNRNIESWKNFKVYKNGLVTFGVNEILNLSQPIKNPFSGLNTEVTPEVGLIAPFWSELNSEFVYFRESDDVSTLLRVSDDIRDLQNSEFSAKSVFVVTWYSPIEYNSSNVTLNAFQMVLATDGSRSKVFFNYYFPTALPESVSAKTSYLVGNSIHVTIREEMANAQAMSIYLTTRSNVGVAGQWLLNIKQPEPQIAKKFVSSKNQITQTETKTGETENSNNHVTHSNDDVTKSENDIIQSNINKNELGNGVTNMDNDNEMIVEVSGKETDDEMKLRDLERECSISKCNGVGQCNNTETSESCICDPGYTGETCALVINECSSFPCLNGGTCKDDINRYSCECLTDFFGINCEVNLTPELRCRLDPECFCPEESSGNNNMGFFTWPKSTPNTLLTSGCPFPTTANAYRQCNDEGKWERVDYSRCQQLSETSMKLQRLFFSIITPENATLVFEAIAGITALESGELSAYDMGNIAFTLRRAVGVLSEISSGDVKNILEALSSISLSSEEERKLAGNLTSANANFIEIVDESALKLTYVGEEPTFVNSTTIDMTVTRGMENNVNFFLKLNGQSGINQSPSTSVQASIQIPSSISNDERIQFVVYKNSTLYDFVGANRVIEDSRFNVSSQVISASVGEFPLENLNEPVIITLSHSSISPNTPVHCVFWVPPNVVGGDGNWLDQGCEVVSRTANQTICECDHLTNFAVLLDIHGTHNQLPEDHDFILMIITYVGCILSVLGLTITILSYLCVGKLRRDLPSKILISLCLALIGGNTFFLFLRFSEYNSISCVAIPAVLHYMLLSAFMWMGLEALNMYIALVRVFNTYYRQYFLKISLVGWGIPLLIVVVTLILHFTTEPSYILVPNQHICWLRREIAFYVLIGPFGIVFLFNIVIFYLVLRQLLGLGSKKIQRKDSRYFKKPVKRESARKLRGAIGLLALLGITWGLSFAAIGNAALVFSYLFVIFNSFQGFWIFIFHCIMKKEISSSWIRWVKGKESLSEQKTRLNGTFHASRNTSIASRTHSTASIKLSSSCEKQVNPKPEVYKQINYNADLNNSTRLVRMIPRPIICPPSTNAATQTDIPHSDETKKYRIISSDNNNDNNFYGKYTPSPDTNVSNDSGAYSDEASI